MYVFIYESTYRKREREEGRERERETHKAGVEQRIFWQLNNAKPLSGQRR